VSEVDPRKIRIGAVSYLNTRPLVWGLQHGRSDPRIELSFDVPARLADRMAAGELEIALLPVVEIARMGEVELVPGLGIVTYGPSRSVLLVARRPIEELSSVALDPDSRTSNALARVLFAEFWKASPAWSLGRPGSLAAALGECDAAVRIGDKALFEPVPAGCQVHDLAEVWTGASGLPFVYAAWVARPGIVDRDLYRLLHASRREGSRAIEQIAQEYRWQGEPRFELAHEYLTKHILFRLGADETRAMELFFRAAHRLGLLSRVPPIRLALRGGACEDAVASVLARGRVAP
jgi:chorismate dehydratase